MCILTRNKSEDNAIKDIDVDMLDVNNIDLSDNRIDKEIDLPFTKE